MNVESEELPDQGSLMKQEGIKIITFCIVLINFKDLSANIVNIRSSNFLPYEPIKHVLPRICYPMLHLFTIFDILPRIDDTFKQLVQLSLDKFSDLVAIWLIINYLFDWVFQMAKVFV